MKNIRYFLVFFIFSFSIKADQIIPVVANTPGAQSSYWKTDITVANPTSNTIEVKQKFHKTGSANEPIESTFTLNPNETRTIENPLEQMGVENASGALELSASTNLAITARTYNLKGAEEFGQGMKSFFENELLKKGEKATFCTVKDNQEYRFNFGLFSKEPSTIKFEVYSNSNLASTIIKEFPANFHIQQDAKTFFGIELNENSAIIAEMLEGKAVLYASSVQNNSGDGSFEEMNRIKTRNEYLDEIDRMYFYEEEFNGKKFKDILKENAQQVAEILAKGYFYDLSNESEWRIPWDKRTQIRKSVTEWKRMIEEMTDGNEETNPEFREMYLFDEFIFYYYHFVGVWEIPNGKNWVIFSDYYPKNLGYFGEAKGLDLIVQGLEEEDIDNLNKLLLGILYAENDAKAYTELIIPVVANTPGAYGSYWKSDLWLFNPYDETIKGKIFFKPSGSSTLDTDGLGFELSPKQVKQYTNFLEQLNVQGAGAAKIIMEQGKIPKAKVSTYNEIQEKELMQGMNGFALEELLKTGQKGYLLNVKDTASFRFNIGIYSEEESEIAFRIYDKQGTMLAETIKNFPEKYHIQQNVNSFFNLELPEDSIIEAKLNKGKAKMYASGVQNISGDGYYQDAITLSQEPRTSIDDTTRNYVFAHDKQYGEKQIWQIILENIEPLAEILSRENVLEWSQGMKEPKHHDKDWWMAVLTALYNNNYQTTFEAQYLLIDSKTKRIVFTDYLVEGEQGQDNYCFNLTDKDIEDFKDVLRKYIK